MNVPGTADCVPVGHPSWKLLYEQDHEWPDECRIFGCTREASGAAHVYVENEDGVYLVPMCATHNHPTETDCQEVNEGTIAKRVYPEHSHGPTHCHGCGSFD